MKLVPCNNFHLRNVFLINTHEKCNSLTVVKMMMMMFYSFLTSCRLVSINQLQKKHTVYIYRAEYGNVPSDAKFVGNNDCATIVSCNSACHFQFKITVFLMETTSNFLKPMSCNQFPPRVTSLMAYFTPVLKIVSFVAPSNLLNI